MENRLKERHGEYEVCSRCHQWIFWNTKDTWVTENGKPHGKWSCRTAWVPEMSEGWITAHILLVMLTVPLAGGWLWIAIAHTVVAWRRNRWAG